MHNIGTATAIKARPPIVGVPLFDKCHEGPSSYIGCFAHFDKTGIKIFSSTAVSTNDISSTEREIAVDSVIIIPLINS
jgi:hypothetical protein